MLKPVSVILVLMGFAMLVISILHGLALSGILPETPLQGWIGGLLPTIFAVTSIILFYWGWMGLKAK